MHFANAQTGWVLSSVSNVNKTSNAGANWEVCHSFGKMFPTCFHFINDQTGWIPIPSYGSYRSTNGGEDFLYQAPIPSFARETFFVNGSIGWISGTGGSISRTINGGVNWTVQISGGTYSAITFYSMHFIDPNTGWAVGWRSLSADSYQSVILKTSNGGLTFIEPVSNAIPDKFSLSQNYPNPFNPETVIRFQISATSVSKLTLYNINGQEVKTLIDQELKPGTYEVNWNAANFPSGVYYYMLSSGSFSEIKKMVLLK